MKRILAILALPVLGAWSLSVFSASVAAANGRNAPSASALVDAGKTNGELSSGTKIVATLKTALDAKKSKAGDRVEARVAQDVKPNGKVVVLKWGTPLIGHVTEVQARTNKQPQSELGIVFDYAVMKSGEQVPLNVTIQGMAVPQSFAAGADSEALGSSDASGGTGLPAGTNSSFGEICDSTRVMTLATADYHDATISEGSAPGAVSNLGTSTARNATGALDDVDKTPLGAAGPVTVVPVRSSSSSNNNGGARNVAASSATTGQTGAPAPSVPLASGSASNSSSAARNVAASSTSSATVLISRIKNVHVDSGTRMLLSVNAQAQ